jgi:MFS family permease
MAVVSVLYAIMASATEWKMFAACWVAATVMNALQWPAMLSMIAESAPPDIRGKVVGLIDACYFAGITLGPVLGAYLIEPFGWSVSGLVLLSAAGYFMSGIIRGVGLKETYRPAARPAPEEGPSLSPMLFGFGLLTVLGYVTYALTVEGPFLALFSEDVLGMNKPDINLLMAAGAGLSLFAALFGGYLTDRIGMNRTFALSAASTALLLVPLSMGSPGAAWIIVLLFVPTEFCQVAYQKFMTTAISESKRATFVGAVNTLIGLTAPASVLVAGGLYSAARAAPFIVAAAASALSLAALPFLRKTASRPQEAIHSKP